MIEQSKKYKIAIVAYNLDIGGLSKVILNLFSLLNKVTSIETSLLLLDNKTESKVFGEMINFGDFTDNNSSFLNKINKYIKFKKYLKAQQFDFIIDMRYRLNPISEIFITKFLYPKTKIIYTVHSSKIETYLPKNTILTKWLYSKAYKIVCVAEANKKVVLKKHQLKNTTTIYNPIDFNDINIKSNEVVSFNFEYILAVGRVVELKQFDKLINSYSNSILPSKKVKLVIVGDGPELEKIKNKVIDLNISDNVVFEGFSNNPYKYMKNARFFILSSQYEGFGLVLAEALACGTPAISFDLVSGPSEIITHEFNGLLVENQNFEKLTKSIELLYRDEKLYTTCKSNANSSVQKFSFEKITEEWLNLMQITIE